MERPAPLPILLALVLSLLAPGPGGAQVAEPPETDLLQLAVRVDPWRDGTASRGDLSDALAPALRVDLSRPASLGDYVPSLQLLGVRIEEGRVVGSRSSRPFLPSPAGGAAVRLLGEAELRAFLLGCCAGARTPVASIRALTAATPRTREEVEQAIARIARTGAMDGIFLFSPQQTVKVDWKRQTVVVLSAAPERGGQFRIRPLLLILERP